MRLGDRYQLLTPIATGGMGQVWRAEDTTLHRIVAAKVLRSEYTGDPTFLARFRAEAQNTAALSHPNIASVYDYGETVQESERLAYLVMELVEGEPLVEILHKRRRLPAAQTLDILQQAATGLDAAHRTGMVHRDIKPGNLIIRPDGVLKITDFGIARAADTVPLTDSGTVVGTAQYLAPEQAEGRPAIAASDVYALGVVGYECLAGFRPFDGDNSVAIALSQIRDLPRPLPLDVAPAIRDLIQHAMAKNARVRLPNGGAFAAAIASVRVGVQAPGQPTGATPAPGAGLNPASQTLTSLPPAPRPPAGAGAPQSLGVPAHQVGPPSSGGGYPPGAPYPQSAAAHHHTGGVPHQAPPPASGPPGPPHPGVAMGTGMNPVQPAGGPPTGYPATAAPPPSAGDTTRRNVLVAVVVGVVFIVVLAIVVALAVTADGPEGAAAAEGSTTQSVRPPSAPPEDRLGGPIPFSRGVDRVEHPHAATTEGQRTT